MENLESLFNEVESWNAMLQWNVEFVVLILSLSSVKLSLWLENHSCGFVKSF